MFGGKINFGVILRLQHFSNSIGPTLESATACHIRFVVKLLWKYCECSITLIFVEPNFL